jgi:undecaprenyl-diphosphatase
MAVGLLARLDARDRSLFLKWSLGEDASQLQRRTWVVITSLGSAAVTVGAVLLPFLFVPALRAASGRAGLALVLSHLVIQLVKRSVGRGRPSERIPNRSRIANPDRFSFPSGHACSSLAVALGYAVGYPPLLAPLVGVGLLVGWSRVVLGVHYPGDVLVGQLIAAVTVLALAI